MTSIVSQAMAEAAEEIRLLRAEVRELKTRAMFSASTIERLQMPATGLLVICREIVKSNILTLLDNGHTQNALIDAINAAKTGAP